MKNWRSIGAFRLLLPFTAVLIVLVVALGSRQVGSSFEIEAANKEQQAKGRYSETLSKAESAAEAAGSSKEAKLEFLRLLLITGKYAQAEEVASNYFKSTSAPEFALMLGKAQRAQGRYSEAEAALRKALTRSDSQ
ncbi:MAG TPA: hypothetical protein PLP42_13955, partial [Acidobacteriota bacterium]|nr:hypothetical protein [Acidobacteriota bacterium]